LSCEAVRDEREEHRARRYRLADEHDAGRPRCPRCCRNHLH
jgi:hypothetical protein